VLCALYNTPVPRNAHTPPRHDFASLMYFSFIGSHNTTPTIYAPSHSSLHTVHVIHAPHDGRANAVSWSLTSPLNPHMLLVADISPSHIYNRAACKTQTQILTVSLNPPPKNRIARKIHIHMHPVCEKHLHKHPVCEIYPHKHPVCEICPHKHPACEICPHKHPACEICPQKQTIPKIHPQKHARAHSTAYTKSHIVYTTATPTVIPS